MVENLGSADAEGFHVCVGTYASSWGLNLGVSCMRGTCSATDLHAQRYHTHSLQKNNNVFSGSIQSCRFHPGIFIQLCLCTWVLICLPPSLPSSDPLAHLFRITWTPLLFILLYLPSCKTSSNLLLACFLLLKTCISYVDI